MKRRVGVAAMPGTLETVLGEAFGFGAVEARALIAQGSVYVDGRRCDDRERMVKGGAKLTTVLEERGGAAPGTPPGLQVLFEDASVLAVNKPAGLAAQPTPSRQGHDLLALASAHLGRPAGLVHRLDKDTTGVTLFGKTKEATSQLAAAFRDGRVKKTYLAVCGPELPVRGEIDLPLSKDPSRPGRWRASKRANGISALTRYERRAVGEGFCVVALFPQTGRTHQLRAHLSGIGAAILGDALYGGAQTPPRPEEAPPGRCLLHAQLLELDDRVYEAPVPEDLQRYVSATKRAG